MLTSTTELEFSSAILFWFCGCTIALVFSFWCSFFSKTSCCCLALKISSFLFTFSSFSWIKKSFFFLSSSSFILSFSASSFSFALFISSSSSDCFRFSASLNFLASSFFFACNSSSLCFRSTSCFSFSIFFFSFSSSAFLSDSFLFLSSNSSFFLACIFSISTCFNLFSSASFCFRYSSFLFASMTFCFSNSSCIFFFASSFCLSFSNCFLLFSSAASLSFFFSSSSLWIFSKLRCSSLSACLSFSCSSCIFLQLSMVLWIELVTKSEAPAAAACLNAVSKLLTLVTSFFSDDHLLFSSSVQWTSFSRIDLAISSCSFFFPFLFFLLSDSIGKESALSMSLKIVMKSFSFAWDLATNLLAISRIFRISISDSAEIFSNFWLFRLMSLTLSKLVSIFCWYTASCFFLFLSFSFILSWNISLSPFGEGFDSSVCLEMFSKRSIGGSWFLKFFLVFFTFSCILLFKPWRYISSEALFFKASSFCRPNILSMFWLHRS